MPTSKQPTTIAHDAAGTMHAIPDVRLTLRPGDERVPMRGWGRIQAVKRGGYWVGFVTLDEQGNPEPRQTEREKTLAREIRQTDRRIAQATKVRQRRERAKLAKVVKANLKRAERLTLKLEMAVLRSARFQELAIQWNRVVSDARRARRDAMVEINGAIQAAKSAGVELPAALLERYRVAWSDGWALPGRAE